MISLDNGNIIFVITFVDIATARSNRLATNGTRRGACRPTMGVVKAPVKLTVKASNKAFAKNFS